MATEHKSIDITNTPELLRLAEEVRASREPRVLRRDEEAIAVLMPLTRAATRGKVTGRVTQADYEAFLSAAGGWKDEDTDRLIADIYESRSRSTRPPVDL